MIGTLKARGTIFGHTTLQGRQSIVRYAQTSMLLIQCHRCHSHFCSLTLNQLHHGPFDIGKTRNPEPSLNWRETKGDTFHSSSLSVPSRAQPVAQSRSSRIADCRPSQVLWSMIDVNKPSPSSPSILDQSGQDATLQNVNAMTNDDRHSSVFY